MVQLLAGIGPLKAVEPDARPGRRQSANLNGVEIKIRGTVQGVGFRPHVYRLALDLGLYGWVVNTTVGVTVHLEGQQRQIERFCHELRDNPPPLARIDSWKLYPVCSEGYSTFCIQESLAVSETELSIPPDTGTCPDCLKEYNNPRDRRFGYEFTNCVNCGPRFSITRAAPYDRNNTSMANFRMCNHCSAEYNDPADRRFHAEPNACPVCGPTVDFRPGAAETMAEDIRHALKTGQILAVKGIGGYHLACNAEDGKTVDLLRERKRRETKPFAVMCRDLEEVRRHCCLTAEEERLLCSPARPIVLLERRPDAALPQEIAPGLNTLGVMLPYTPLHYGLFDRDLASLVMTSANISGDPQILTAEEAHSELKDLVDRFVDHPREIVNRVDDSVLMLRQGQEYLIRRSRGYVPQKIILPTGVPEIFAAGGDLKAVFAYSRANSVVLSQYFGDLENVKNFDAYRQGAEFFRGFLQVTPQLAVADLHPNYFSASFARSLNLPLQQIQHHEAHFASCMADNGVQEKVLGVICDGTGYGVDGTIQGCEFFYGDYSERTRVGSLEQFFQPRGDRVQKNPWQMAAMLLYELGYREEEIVRLFPHHAETISLLANIQQSKLFTVKSSSCGRLFDAASALCGVTTQSTYEGEAAIRLESLVGPLRDVKPYPFAIRESDLPRLSWSFLESIAADKAAGRPPEEMSTRFHRTFGDGLLQMLALLNQRFPAKKVVFSGGTFQNRVLSNYLAEKTSQLGLDPLFHRQVPTNDGGLALGQIMLAAAERQ